jgi:hypothetical protein
MGSPSSVRFDDTVLARINAFVATHPGLSLSSASNLLVDEALREHEHPLITFRDGPAGRRARLIGGPDVWEVVRAVRSARAAEPLLSPEDIVELVVDTSGVPAPLVRAAVTYWADYGAEIDALMEHAHEEEERARRRWEHERALLQT